MKFFLLKLKIDPNNCAAVFWWRLGVPLESFNSIVGVICIRRQVLSGDHTLATSAYYVKEKLTPVPANGLSFSATSHFSTHPL